MSPRLGRRMARVNRRVTNRVVRPLATWLPGLGVVVHTGRRSGREHRTPVNVFRAPGAYVFALTYGREAEWVSNVLAAGGCELITGGRRIRLTAPELFRDDRRRAVPGFVRPMLALLDVSEFLRCRIADGPTPSARGT